MRTIVCSTYRESINIDPNLSASKCDKRHSFVLRDGILDLLSGTMTKNLLEEEKHWDEFATSGSNSFMQEKVFEDYRFTFSELGIL
jgi:hypothetical protein